jgi:two-component system sensor histidine kinase TctE
MTSLRQRVVLWLMPPLLVVGAVAAAGAYFFMADRLTAAYDQDLGDIARALIPYLEERDGKIALAFTPQADAVLRSDSSERIFYAVLDPRGRTIAGDADLPEVHDFEGDGPAFWDARARGRSLRMAAIRAAVQRTPVIVVAAETTGKRDRAARDALLSAILPVLLLAIAMLVAVILGVQRGLDPAEQLRAQLAARPPGDLRPVGEPAVAELRPLVQALNEMLARLEQSRHTQTRFIADAAHQLRTPIAGIVTQLDLARKDTADREEHLQLAREGATRLARLAQQILSLTAADPVSNPEAPREPCDLARIVESHADVWVRSAGPRGVELGFDLAPAPTLGNAVLIGEMATNLVDNAARYGARNVTVATRRWGDKALIEVTDDGPGIPSSQRERVFDRFHRLDNANGEGSGLGLAIVREIAERHHAAIEMTDGPERMGTRIGVLFPAA